jgi:hypothetical protein
MLLDREPGACSLTVMPVRGYVTQPSAGRQGDHRFAGSRRPEAGFVLSETRRLLVLVLLGLLVFVPPMVLGPVVGEGIVIPYSRDELGFGSDS